MGDEFLDLPPDVARTFMKNMGIDPEYFLTVTRELDNSGLAAARDDAGAHDRRCARVTTWDLLSRRRRRSLVHSAFIVPSIRKKRNPRLAIASIEPSKHGRRIRRRRCTGGCLYSGNLPSLLTTIYPCH
jgi:hypothetical protein